MTSTADSGGWFPNMSSNAEKILGEIDRRLDAAVDLTLYGRAALHLGFPNPPIEFALSTDVDAILAIGQAQALAGTSNFWDAVQQTNTLLAPDGLYASHFFEERQVLLRSCWKETRVRIPGPWKKLQLWRLHNLDLLLSKLMRDDPQDLRDAEFIVRAGNLTEVETAEAVRQARVPEIPEIRDQFQICRQKLWRQLNWN